jgi:hypothetical protein
MGAASTQVTQESNQVCDAVGVALGPISASVAHLNVKGTATVASLAKNSRTADRSTRCFKSRRSDGQM